MALTFPFLPEIEASADLVTGRAYQFLRSDKPAVKSCFEHLLTEEEREEITEDIKYDEETVRAVVFDDHHGCSVTYSWSVIQCGELFELWCYEPIEDLFEFEESFLDEDDADLRAQERAEETEEAARISSDDHNDELWELEGQGADSDFTGPFTFTDNTDYPEGWELEDEEDVFDFFRTNPSLLNQEEWGNLYSCSLRDANDDPCWVSQSHRGEMRLERLDSGQDTES